VTTFSGWGGIPSKSSGPIWSPDGRQLAYVTGGDPQFWQYGNARLAVVPVGGGTPQPLTDHLDRQVFSPRWTPDGTALVALLEEDRMVQVARISLRGTVDHLTTGAQVAGEITSGRDGQLVAVVSTDLQPTELAVVEHGEFRRLTHHNDSLMATVQLARVDDFTSTSRDGTVVQGLLYSPPATTPGAKLPLVVWLHGGPFGQNQHDFDPRRQAAAMRGYAVLAVNYRGSSGRGEAFSRAIFADWGNKEVTDVQGAVDRAVVLGLADPERLGVGGWSYGGILTDYLIASDTRFKAAVAGAGNANWLTMYGVDQFVSLYENELGSPWSHLDTWLKVSYPFLHADRIKTPALFLGGEKDLNVPIVGGEQMYQALRTLGVETQLVIYPGMYHGPTRPRYRVDIVERFLDWWGRYLQ
jgi:dipeptidyl aminopeptidase/acylaminoacyl peptidase